MKYRHSVIQRFRSMLHRRHLSKFVHANIRFIDYQSGAWIQLRRVHRVARIDLQAPTAAAGATEIPPASSAVYRSTHPPLQFVHHVRESVQPLIGQLFAGTWSLRLLATTAIARCWIISREVPSDLPSGLPTGDSDRLTFAGSSDGTFASIITTSVLPTIADVRRQAAAQTPADRCSTRALVSGIVAIQTNHRPFALAFPLDTAPMFVLPSTTIDATPSTPRYVRQDSRRKLLSFVPLFSFRRYSNYIRTCIRT